MPEEKLAHYAELRTEALELYNSFGAVRCPAFDNELVHFTAEGFNHLIYRRKKKPRDPRVQIMKFELLPRAKTLIESTTTFQEQEEMYQYITVERRGKKETRNVLVRSWGLVAIVNRFRIRVVIRQVGNGKKHFFSVIPAWVTRQYRDIKLIETSTGSGLMAEEDDSETLKNAT